MSDTIPTIQQIAIPPDDPIDTQWIALVITPGNDTTPGLELNAPDYQRTQIPLPDVNGVISEVTISSLTGWAIAVGFEVWDAKTGGAFLYGDVFRWPLGPDGAVTMITMPDGTLVEKLPLTFA